MKLQVGGVEKDVERVHVKMAGEPWGEVLLEDNHVLRVRTIVTGVYRVVGELDPMGRPVYHVEYQTIVKAEPEQ